MVLGDRIARGFTASLFAQLCRTGSKAAMIILLSRYLLTNEQYGLLFFAVSVMGVLGIMGYLGIPPSTARYITEYHEKEPGQVPHVIRRSFGSLLVLSGVVAGSLALFHRPLANVLGEPELAPLLLIGVGYVVSYALLTYFKNIFQGFNRVEYSGLMTSLGAIGQATFAVAFVLAGFGIVGAMAGLTLGYVLAAAFGLTFVYSRFYEPETADEAIEEGLHRRLLEYSLPLTATRGAAILDQRIDTVLVGVLVNPVAVSYYTVAKQVSSVAGTVAGSLGFTISPAVGEQQAADDQDRAARLYESTLEKTLLLYVPGSLGLLLVADPLVPLVFGGSYAAAVPVMQVMAGYVLVFAITGVTSKGLDFLGRARTRAVFKVGTAVANVLLNLALIPSMGALGAAVATLITHTVYAGANVAIMCRELPVQLERLARAVLASCFVAGAMGVGVFVLMPYVDGLPSLLAVVGVGVGIWGVVSVAGGLLEPRRLLAFFS